MRSIDHSTSARSRARPGESGNEASVLQIDNLDVYYGQAHVLQGISIDLGQGVLAVVGRNGMGKSTLCKAITGMVPATGSIRFAGQDLLGLQPDEITRLGVAYVPQGRRVWRSLTVDETLRLAARSARQGAWTVERVYSVFPRLAERRNNGGAQLSGGEQQMLAIGRALLFNPRLMVMDEPTEGLAPVIVEQVATLLKSLADERSMSVLLIEQNLGVALEVADDVAIMVNGRIAHRLPAATLAADRALQQRLLGLKAGAADTGGDDGSESAISTSAEATGGTVLRVVRSFGSPSGDTWADAHPEVPNGNDGEQVRRQPVAATSRPAPMATSLLPSLHGDLAAHDRAVYLAGGWGAQQRELSYVKRCLEQLGARVITVDIGSSGFSTAQVGARELMRHHPGAGQGHDVMLAPSAEAVSSATLEQAFAGYLRSRRDLGALLVITRGETSAVGCAGALALPMGMPKLVVTDRALPATDSDVLVMTAPIGELNRVSETLLAHAAAAVAGMVKESAALHRAAKPLVCITALDLASAAVRHARRALGEGVDCLVLNMAAGGASTLTRLASSGLIAGVIDLAPVDVSQAVITGQRAAAQARFAAMQASGVPYVLVPTLLELTAFPLGQAVPATLLQRELLSSALDGSIVPLARGEVTGLVEWLSPMLGGFDGLVQVLLPRPTDAALRQLGGGSDSIALQQAIQQGLMRRIKPGRDLQIQELPDTLNDMRTGEVIGHALRALIQARAVA